MRKNNTKNRPNAKKRGSSKRRPSGISYGMKMKVKKGDMVVVVSGKDKGKQGTILEVRPKENRIVVDGVAIAKRSIRAQRGGQSGRIVERPAAINASNVMLLDPSEKKPTRVGREKGEKGKLVRIAKKSKTVVK